MSQDCYARALALKHWSKIDVEEVDSTDSVKVEMYFKAVVVEGKGYRAMVTDMLEIWEETLPKENWEERWASLDCNGQIVAKGNSREDFLIYNLDGVNNPHAKWMLERVRMGGVDRLSLKLIDTTPSRKFVLNWKMLLTLHNDSAGMIYQHVTLPLAAMLSYRNAESQSLMEAIRDRDEIVTTLVKDVKEAGLTLQRGTRVKPQIKINELQERTPSSLMPSQLLDSATAQLYEETTPALLDWNLFSFRGQTPKVPPEPKLKSSASMSSLKRRLSEAPNLDLDDPTQISDPTVSATGSIEPDMSQPDISQASDEPPKKKKKKKRDKEL